MNVCNYVRSNENHLAQCRSVALLLKSYVVEDREVVLFIAICTYVCT